MLWRQPYLHALEENTSVPIQGLHAGIWLPSANEHSTFGVWSRLFSVNEFEPWVILVPSLVEGGVRDILPASLVPRLVDVQYPFEFGDKCLAWIAIEGATVVLAKGKPTEDTLEAFETAWRSLHL